MGRAYTGGCACGAIRYAIDDAAVFEHHCQCRDCQRRSGTGHSSYLTFPDRTKVTISGVEKLVQENESVYITATHWHRLENPGKVPLEMIEVQIGSYLGEDDIIRSDDIYARGPDEVR